MYPTVINEAELERRLREGQHGVMVLADGGKVYAVVLSCQHWERLLVRVRARRERPWRRRTPLVQFVTTS